MFELTALTGAGNTIGVDVAGVVSAYLPTALTLFGIGLGLKVVFGLFRKSRGLVK